MLVLTLILFASPCFYCFPPLHLHLHDFIDGLFCLLWHRLRAYFVSRTVLHADLVSYTVLHADFVSCTVLSADFVSRTVLRAGFVSCTALHAGFVSRTVLHACFVFCTILCAYFVSCTVSRAASFSRTISHVLSCFLLHVARIAWFYRCFVLSPAFAYRAVMLTAWSSHEPGFARFGTQTALLST